MIEGRRKILFSFDNEWNIRYFIHTNFLSKLVNKIDIDIIILVSSNIQNLDDLKKIPNTKFIKTKNKNNSFLRKFLNYLLLILTYASSKKISRTDLIRSGYINSVRYGILLRKYISKFKTIRILFSALTYLLSFLSITPEKLIFVLRNKPNLIITNTPGISFPDIELIAISKLLMIKSLCFVYSWDNLVTKGPLILKPNFLGVWNKFMYDEATSIHNFKKRNIKITGSFVYEKLSILKKEIEEIKNKKDFKKNKTILIASHLKKYSGSSYYDLVEDIQEQESLISYDRILFRAHPFDDLFDKKETYLKSIPKLEIDNGLKRVDELEKFISQRNFERNLIKSIIESDWIITGATTFALDALFLGKEIGLLNYYPKGNHSKKGLELKSIQESYEYEHFKEIISDENVTLINSKKDLLNYFKKINIKNNKKMISSKISKQILPEETERSSELAISFIKKIL